MESSRVRLAADVGGTFTDVAAFDETTGELRLGKTLTTPSRLVTGVEAAVTKAGTQFSSARLFLHGTTRRDQHYFGADRSGVRAADHARVPGYLRDRPRQSA